ASAVIAPVCGLPVACVPSPLLHLLRSVPPRVFFFPRRRHHRALHSFPTRRSSDLIRVFIIGQAVQETRVIRHGPEATERQHTIQDRKSTRLNSSHLVISYAVFCLKKKKRCKHHFRTKDGGKTHANRNRPCPAHTQM